MKKLLLLLVVCVLFAGCVPSLHSLYTDDNIVFDAALLGNWAENDGKAVYEFDTEDSVSYAMVLIEDSMPSTFAANLVQLGAYLFLDIVPDKPECGNDFYKEYLIPAHSFYKVTLENNMLRLDGLALDWLKEQLDNGNLTIAHETIDDNSIILTASTIDLQELVLSNVNNEAAFPEGDETFRQD